MANGNGPESSKQYLTFQIGNEEYAIGILRVREILEFTGVTRVPSMPACVRGVLNLRGSVLPVIDLASMFGFEAKEVTKQTCVIVVEVEHDGQASTLGVITDAVNEVIELPEEQIEPAPAFGTAAHSSYLVGLGNAGGSFVMILDVDRLLSIEELINSGTAAALLENNQAAATAGA